MKERDRRDKVIERKRQREALKERERKTKREKAERGGEIEFKEGKAR